MNYIELMYYIYIHEHYVLYSSGRGTCSPGVSGEDGQFLLPPRRHQLGN